MEGLKKFRYFDIAANLCDNYFKGIYHGKKRHEADHAIVIERAKKVGVEHFLFAGGHLEDTLESLELCQRFENGHTTLGIHPCYANVILKENS